MDEFHAAIKATALRFNSDVHIIASEMSGKTAAWIFDFRSLMLQPRWLDRYSEIFWERYASQYPFQVGGMETAGIALVAAIVMKSFERGTPVNGFFIRKSRKREGLMKAIEGTLTDEPVILVDDLIHSGSTVQKETKILESLGKKVTDVFILLAYRERNAYAHLGPRITPLYVLTDFGIPLLPSEAPEIPKDSFETLWHYSAEHPSRHLVVQKSAPIIDDVRVYFGIDDGTFLALNQNSGAVDWRFKTGRHPPGKGILSTPALYDSVVYFGAYDGSVYALDAATGIKKWVYADADWVGSSPAVASDLGLLFIGLEFGLFRKQGGCIALSLDAGEMHWEARVPKLTHGSPLYVAEEKLVIVGSNDGVVYAYDAKNGEIRWHYASLGDIKSSLAYDAKRRTILFGSMDGKLYVLSARDGTPLFAHETGAGIYSTPLVKDDTAFFASLDKNIYAIDLTRMKIRWTFETRGRIFASPLMAEGSLWIGSNDGTLYELHPDTGALRTSFQATERIVNRIAYNEEAKRFFVPTQANELYCLKRKPA